jgi:hypothetical protein
LQISNYNHNLPLPHPHPRHSQHAFESIPTHNKSPQKKTEQEHPYCKHKQQSHQHCTSHSHIFSHPLLGLSAGSSLQLGILSLSFEGVRVAPTVIFLFVPPSVLFWYLTMFLADS